jgi:outer membrane protein TolC
MRHFTFLALGIAANFAQAQPLTLQDALHTVAGNSPTIQRASSEENEAYWKKMESYSAFLPKITAGATYITDYKYLLTNIALPGSNTIFAIPGIVPTTTYTLTAELNVFDGFASTNRTRSASAMENAATEQLEVAKFLTEREVILQFYRALAAKTLKQVAESNLKTLQDHLRDVGLSKRSGVSTNYDVLRVEVQVSEANSEVLNSVDDVETANGHLAELLGEANTAEPNGQLPEPPASLIDKLNGPYLDRADLQALGNQVAALRYQKYAADAHWAPRIGIFGQYQYYNNLNDHFDDWSNFRDAYTLGVNLTWNLFEGGASEARRREAIEKQIQSEKTLRISQLKAQQDVALWTRKYKYFHSVYKARQSDIGKAKESVRLAREGRRVGSRTNTDLLDAETDLFRSQAGAIKAQLGIIEALINLELSTGRKLYEFN